MEVKELTFSYKDLLHNVRATDIHKLVDYKMNEIGFYKSTELADKAHITRQAMSQRIHDNPEKYLTVEYAGYLYAKKVC